MKKDKNSNKQLGKKIRILMQSNRISLTALATKMKISPQLLYYRLNKGYRFSVQELQALAPLLNISEEKLIEIARQTVVDNQ